MRSTLRVAAAVLTLALSWPAGAAAAENEVFGVSPQPGVLDGAARRAIAVPVHLDGKLRDGVRVYNHGPRPVTLRVYAATADMQADGIIAIGPRAATSGVAGAVRVGEDSVRLDPGQDTVVAVTVASGAFTELGQMAAVVVEEAPGAGESAIDLVQRVAVLVRAAPEGTPVPAGPPEQQRRVLVLAAALALAGAAGLRAWQRRPPRPVAQAARPAEGSRIGVH